MVERDPQLAPVGQLEREMVEVVVALADERDRVVIGAEVQPRALVAEAIGEPHPEHVAVERDQPGKLLP